MHDGELAFGLGVLDVAAAAAEVNRPMVEADLFFQREVADS